MEKLLIKNTEKTTFNFFKVLPFIGNMWVREHQSLFLHLNDLVGVQYFVVANNQCDFKKVSPFVRHGPFPPLLNRLYFEHIEMPDFIAEIMGIQLTFLL